MQLLWTTHFYVCNEVQEVKKKTLDKGEQAKNQEFVKQKCPKINQASTLF